MVSNNSWFPVPVLEKHGKSVGFLARAYKDITNPQIGEIVRTATSYTVFFWLIILIFASIFFSREYTDSTIKIAIASGQSRIRFFFAKYVVIVLTCLAAYSVFVLAAYVIECLKLGVSITAMALFPILKVLFLNCLVIVTFIGISLMLCVVFKHTAIVVGVMCLFTFSGPLIYMMTWDSMAAQSWKVLSYLKMNPMYYLMNTCAYNMIPNLENEIYIYFAAGIVITTMISIAVLRKQELR